MKVEEIEEEKVIGTEENAQIPETYIDMDPNNEEHKKMWK